MSPKRTIRLLATVVLLAGCGDAGPATYDVSGQVTWNGQPVERGSIQFSSPEDKQPPISAKIIAGNYELACPAGPRRVEIRGLRSTGVVDPAMGVEGVEEYIPAAFNSKSELSADVKADGSNRFDFHLPAR
ncbi:MAG: hypothetical protein KDA42_04530 [Planctomycetales bacterium]|nr:hypothetical protein [Planctomycetales bacterium]